jgi:RNA polymerase sigma-70 factor, ECF subfamily
MDALRARKSNALREQPLPAPVTDPVSRAELAAALDAVSEDHREPFLLIEVFGLSYQEAADVLQVKVGTVKSRMHRARLSLAQALSEEEDAGGL